MPLDPIPPCVPRPPTGVDLGQPRVGLALSGGGYRAAGFHIGTLDALDNLGLIDQVSNLTTVSGGSIAGVRGSTTARRIPPTRTRTFVHGSPRSFAR